MGPVVELNHGISLRIFNRTDVVALYNSIQKNKAFLHEWKAWYKKLETKQLVQVFIDENLAQIDHLFDSEVVLSTHPGFQCGLFTEKNEVIGLIGFQGINVLNKVAALGYWIDEDWQGKGIVTQGVQKLIEYGWDVLDIHRMEIQSWIGNSKSAQVAQRLGFVHEAILKEIEYRDGVFIDHDLFRLIPSDSKK